MMQLCYRPHKFDDFQVAKQKQTIEAAKKKLKQLLSIPITNKSAVPDITNPNVLKKKIKIFRRRKKAE